MTYSITLTEQPEQTLYGLHQPSSDRTQSRDIPSLSKRFSHQLGEKPGDVLPFYVISKDYRPDDGSFSLFIGGERPCELECETLPAGTYAVLSVRPKLGFLWGPAIGQAKRWFYTRWLPESGYEAVNLEYERHTLQAVGRNPSIELHFAIRRKTK